MGPPPPLLVLLMLSYLPSLSHSHVESTFSVFGNWEFVQINTGLNCKKVIFPQYKKTVHNQIKIHLNWKFCLVPKLASLRNFQVLED